MVSVNYNTLYLVAVKHEACSSLADILATILGFNKTHRDTTFHHRNQMGVKRKDQSYITLEMELDDIER